MNTKRVGAIDVRAISDGTLPSNLDVIIGVERAELERLAGPGSANGVGLAVNNFCFEANGKLVLIDVGAGPTLGPGTGKLLEGLKAAGIAPGDVDQILLTHLHPDHSNGLIDGDGRAIFAKAELFLHEEEARFWLDKPTLPDDPERLQRVKRAAQAGIGAYRGRTHRITDGEILPGITARLLPGHTLGHTGWQIESQGHRLLAWADIVHLASVQVPRPDAALIFDTDPAMATKTRKDLFAEVAREKALVAGSHLPFPGFGYLRTGDDGYVYEAA